MSTHYTLPSSPDLQCEDRFSILDSDELNVPFWNLFEKLLQNDIRDVKALIDILETIAITLRGTADTDYGFLREYIETKQPRDFFSKTWPCIVDIALRMPVLFPSHRLPILSASNPGVNFSREQISCLVVHQFLCTLKAPTWQDGFQDFHIWYSSEQPHASVVEAYLTALFTYFQRLTDGGDTNPLAYNINDWPISFDLCTSSSPTTSNPSPTLSKLEIIPLEEPSTAPSLLGLPDGASVISANKYIGFGRSGTQEETHVGASPECCPAVLITPPLQDDQVLVATGPEPMIAISGYGRAAKCTEVLVPGSYSMRKRTMLFMDALELDIADQSLGLPDVQPGNVAREMKKARAAFNSHVHLRSDPYSAIVTGFWGCRSFGGNVGIKTLIQLCAASRTEIPLMKFVCSGSEQRAFGLEMEKFIDQAQKMKVDVNQLEDVLLNLEPGDFEGEERVLDVVLARLKAA